VGDPGSRAYTAGMSRRVALFGGSFDPIHIGHLIIAQALTERLKLERVLFLPSARPPHKEDRQLASSEDRATMVQLAIAGEALFAYSDFDLTRHGPTYTIDTVTHFRAELGADVELHWIIGADSLAELATWRRVADLIDACRIVTAARPGSQPGEPLWTALGPALGDARIAKLRAAVVDTPRIDISSTDIRRRVAEGRSIRYFVPDPVAEHITEHGLYSGR